MKSPEGECGLDEIAQFQERPSFPASGKLAFDEDEVERKRFSSSVVENLCSVRDLMVQRNVDTWLKIKEEEDLC